jgi:hypothetical protein
MRLEIGRICHWCFGRPRLRNPVPMNGRKFAVTETVSSKSRSTGRFTGGRFARVTAVGFGLLIQSGTEPAIPRM